MRVEDDAGVGGVPADPGSDTDAINQAAGNVQVNGNWLSPVQAAALQAAAPASGGINLAGPPTITPGMTPQPLQVPPAAPSGWQPGQDTRPLVNAQPTVNPTTGTPLLPETETGTPPPPAAPAPTGGAAPWANTQIPNNVGFVPTGQAPASAPPSAAPTPAPARAGGGGGGGGVPAAFRQEGANEQAAAEAQKVLETQSSMNQLGVGQRQAAAQAALDQQRQQNDQDIQQRVTDLLGRSKSIADEFLNKKVDPNQYWGNMSTGDHALAGLSMILSGIGSGIQGKDNLAVKHFDTAVEQDIASQRYNIEHGKEASEMYTNLAKEYQAAGLDRDRALDAAGLAVKQKALTDGSNQALALGGQKAQADFLAKTAPIQAKIATDTQNWTKGAAEIEAARATAAHTRAETSVLGLQAGQAAVERSAELKMANGATLDQLTPAEQQIFKLKHAEEAVPLPNGRVIYAQGKDSAGKALDANEKFNAMDGALSTLVNKIQSGATPGEINSTAETAKNVIGANLGLSREAGAVDGTENALNAAIPTHGWLAARTVDRIDNQAARDIARINAARVLLRQSHEGVLRARARPGQVPKEVTGFKPGG